MRYAHDNSTTRVVSFKSSLELACDCRLRHKESCGLLKHVSKPYVNRNHSQCYIVEIVYDFSMTRESRAIKIKFDNHMQQLYAKIAPCKSALRWLQSLWMNTECFNVGPVRFSKQSETWGFFSIFENKLC